MQHLWGQPARAQILSFPFTVSDFGGGIYLIPFGIIFITDKRKIRIIPTCQEALLKKKTELKYN